MFLNSGFSFQNLKSIYCIKPGLPKYDDNGEEQYYITVHHSSADKGRMIISQTKGDVVTIHTSFEYPQDSIALRFAGINTQQEKDILEFCNEYGLLYINLQDNEQNNDYIFEVNHANEPQMLDNPDSHYCMSVDEFVFQVLQMRRIIQLNSAIDSDDIDYKEIIEILTWFMFQKVYEYDDEGDAVVSEYECLRFRDYYCNYYLQELYEERECDKELPSVMIKEYLDLISEYSRKKTEWYEDDDWWALSYVYQDMKHFSWKYMYDMFSKLLERVDIISIDPVGYIRFSRELSDEDVSYICPDYDKLKMFIQAFISDHFKSILQNVRPEMVVQDGILTPNLHISNLLEALYIDLFFRFSPYIKMRKCANPTCNKHFQISRDNSKKIYCSVSCAQLMAKRMQRERERAARKKG